MSSNIFTFPPLCPLPLRNHKGFPCLLSLGIACKHPLPSLTRSLDKGRGLLTSPQRKKKTSKSVRNAVEFSIRCPTIEEIREGFLFFLVAGGGLTQHFDTYYFLLIFAQRFIGRATMCGTVAGLHYVCSATMLSDSTSPPINLFSFSRPTIISRN